MIEVRIVEDYEVEYRRDGGEWIRIRGCDDVDGMTAGDLEQILLRLISALARL